MRILDLIFYWAKAKPDHVAIIQPDVILTFKTLTERVQSAARRISRLDLDAQEPVAVLIEDQARQLIVCFALMELGLTIAPARGNLLPHMRISGIKTLIHDGKNPVVADGKIILFDESWLTANKHVGNKQELPLRKNGDLIFFTSGSTGVPKKTIYTVDAFFERLYRVNPWIEGNFARTLIFPSIDGSYGFFPSWAILSTGRTICFGPSSEVNLLLVSNHCINYIIASPQQALDLVGAAEKNNGYKLDSLKAFRIGGGLVTKDLVNRIQAHFCPNVIITYGSTEAGTMAFATYDTIAHVPGAVGMLAPWTELEIVDDAGNIVSAGVEGLVRARTPTFLEHLAAENPGMTIDEVRNAWWQPGDIGRLTVDGILCISGRIDDVLNRGGASVSAVDLDGILRSYAGIADAGVCGVIGDTGILQIWAGIVPRPDFDFDTFMRSLQQDETLKSKLEFLLDNVVVVERIPRTQVGKIKRNELREMLIKMNPAAPA